MLSPDQVSWLRAYEDWWGLVSVKGGDMSEEHALRMRMRDAQRSLDQDQRVEAMSLYKASGNRIP